MTKSPKSDLQLLLDARFSDAPNSAPMDETNALLRSMAGRGSCRAFLDKPVPHELLEGLSAIALASPTKSDLQQRDIIFLSSETSRRQLVDLIPGQSWVADSPVIALFCGNNRRQRLLHEWQNVPFANDHLDAFFNAAVDAAVALGAFVTAAEAVGLGCCPISAVRNDAATVSALLDLPDYVFPVAGLAIGFPAARAKISKRLPLAQTVHFDKYQETDLKAAVEKYDQDRIATQPYKKQRYPEAFGAKNTYGWSDDKVRQYSRAERDTFGQFVRSKGFSLD